MSSTNTGSAPCPNYPNHCSVASECPLPHMKSDTVPTETLQTYAARVIDQCRCNNTLIKLLRTRAICDIRRSNEGKCPDNCGLITGIAGLVNMSREDGSAVLLARYEFLKKYFYSLFELSPIHNCERQEEMEPKLYQASFI
ncbi:MAG: hypothetical protein WCJ19_02560 [bacterium]